MMTERSSRPKIRLTSHERRPCSLTTLEPLRSHGRRHEADGRPETEETGNGHHQRSPAKLDQRPHRAGEKKYRRKNDGHEHVAVAYVIRPLPRVQGARRGAVVPCDIARRRAPVVLPLEWRRSQIPRHHPRPPAFERGLELWTKVSLVIQRERVTALRECFQPLGEHCRVEHTETRNLIRSRPGFSAEHGRVGVLGRLYAAPDRCLITTPGRPQRREGEEQRRRVIAVHPAQPERALLSHAALAAPTRTRARCSGTPHERSMCRWAAGNAPRGDIGDSSWVRTDASRPSAPCEECGSPADADRNSPFAGSPRSGGRNTMSAPPFWAHGTSHSSTPPRFPSCRGPRSHSRETRRPATCPGTHPPRDSRRGIVPATCSPCDAR